MAISSTNSFGAVLGHAGQVDLLRRTLASGRVAPAYLFAGPAHVGKKTIAAIFAAALNCERGGDDPCNECASCRKVWARSHPDVRFVRPEGATFRIEQVRAVRRQIALRPLEGRYKVFVLTDVEKMRPQAGNALLKTLEEPPGAGVLVLVTTNLNALLPTIRSRCQTLKFLPVPTEELVAGLRDRGAGDEAANRAALDSEGRVGLAMEQIAADVGVTDELPPTLRGPSLLEAFRLAEEWQKTPESLDRLLSWYRDLLLLRIGAPQTAMTHRRQLRALELLARQETIPSLRNKMRAIMQAQYRLQRNVNATLTLETLAFQLIRRPLTHLPRQRLE